MCHPSGLFHVALSRKIGATAFHPRFTRNLERAFQIQESQHFKDSLHSGTIGVMV